MPTDSSIDSARAGAESSRVPAPVMAAMSPVREPSGIVALAHARRPATLDEVLADCRHSSSWCSTAFRTREMSAPSSAPRTACGATGVIAAEGTADPFGWKALRGAMGSTFRLPIADAAAGAATLATGFASTAASPSSRRCRATARRCPAPAFAGPVAILLGGEGRGPAGRTRGGSRRAALDSRCGRRSNPSTSPSRPR